MRTLIVDDERYAREELRELLKAFEQVEIVGEAENAQAARRQIESLRPDLLFLDIQMPEESGLDLLASLKSPVPRVIFTTAYDAYAIRAFEFGAADYLLKPIAPKRLSTALGRVAGTSNAPIDDPELVDADISSQPLVLADKVLVSDGDRIWYLPVADIIGAEADGPYSVIWLASASPLIRRSLTSLEARLPATHFFRANRSQLVNLQHVQSVAPWFSGGLKLTLTGDRSVELSRRQAKTFRQASSL